MSGEILRRLRQTDWRVAVVVSGGGSSFLSEAFSRSGASRNFVEASIPYSRASMNDYLGRKLPSASVSMETAKVIAAVAFDRAKTLSDQPTGSFAGISLTAALPTSPPRDQIHQICMAIVVDDGNGDDGDGVKLTRACSHRMDDPQATRQQGETLACKMLFHALESLLDGTDLAFGETLR